MITFDCTNCGERLSSPASKTNQGEVCPKCKTFVRVPAASTPHGPRPKAGVSPYGSEELGCFGTILLVAGALCVIFGFINVIAVEGFSMLAVTIVIFGGWLMMGLGAIARGLKGIWRLLARLSDRP